MRFFIYSCFVFSLFLIFSSCSNKQYQVLFEQRNNIADTNAQKANAIVNDYHIQPQDILEIRNLQNINYIVTAPSTSAAAGSGNTTQGQFQVEENGKVALPVIGHVQVAGLTRIAATMKIEKLYRDTLLKDPIIDVKIINLKVTILGEIKGQGNYPLVKDRTSLVEMIGEAGGLTERADERNIKIIRGSKDNPVVTQVDLSDIRSLTDRNTILQNGDIIYIAQNKRAVRTDKLTNFSIIMQPALLIFNTALIIFTLARH